ncbi:phosphatase PAP2 family protein [Chryseobacterium sp. Leaf394]|jgi:membrane-associated phospholipid phosphatase|uniref:phosphatase PAP2 family protein n=1 Tax=Chryseobacterium sp. Leaf394 TaxID=1736361 RepID=UPI0009EB6DBC|nr:phosphatase PAP2 family protein [Chryseobacterium sp. Leaf394]
MRLTIFLKNNERLLFKSTLITLLVIFIVLAVFVFVAPPEFLDIHISEEIQEKQTPLLNKIMIWISWFGQPLTAGAIVILSSFSLFIFKFKREAVLILSTLLSSILGLGLKMLVNRPRPSKDLVVLLEETKFQSFPSGHVLFYTVFCGALILIILRSKAIKNKIKLFLIATCLSVIFFGSVSRVYLGAHWFTDVLGAFVLGVFIVLIMGYFYIEKEKNVSEI